MSTNSKPTTPTIIKTINVSGSNSGQAFVNINQNVLSYNPWGYVPPAMMDEYFEPQTPKDGRDGCVCKSCKEFMQYAEPNQEDKSFICYKCRNGL
jgi:hypothetical protein